ncbi:MAG: hypothetical protein BMS9Abin25_1057 [Gammaproteobacteria bacterium]|nr:MAG: hypothetical protein BMS9Abin25_1057 [Gammaproteobacteria bacterium]
MNFKKLKIPALVLVLWGLATTGFAFEDGGFEQAQKTPTLYSSAPSFGSSLGRVSQFSIGQGWLNNKWQGQSSLYKTKSLDVGLLDTSQWSVDITRRLLSGKQNTYLAMGLGWNDVEVAAGESSFGMRFIAEGRVGIYGPTYLFGQAALSPWMTNVGQLVDPFGKELELGLAVDPLPSMSLRAGYRGYWLDSAESSSDPSLRSQTDGFFIGGGLRW